MTEQASDIDRGGLRAFAWLYSRLEGAKSLHDKIDALKLYFGAASVDDSARAAALLLGNGPSRVATPRDLRAWAAQATGLPSWLVERSYAASGDLSEAMALLVEHAGLSGGSFKKLPSWPGAKRDVPLARWLDEFLPALSTLGGSEKQPVVAAAWGDLAASERIVFNKLLTGSFRVRGGRQILERALAETAGLPRALVSQRLDATASPLTSDAFRLLTSQHPTGGAAEEPDCAGLPYPFFPIAATIFDTLSDSDTAEWLAEYRYSGSVRAQLVNHGGCAAVWSSEQDNYTRRLPEIAAAGDLLPEDSIAEGFIACWDVQANRPLPAGQLQQRLAKSEATYQASSGEALIFLPADLLQLRGRDLRGRTFAERRRLLGEVTQTPMPLPFNSWDELRDAFNECRAYGADGILLRRLNSAYGAAEEAPSSLFIPAASHAVDAVLLYAEAARGQGVSRFTNYTFGVWGAPGDERILIPITKTPDGLSDGERRQIDRYVLKHTVERHGPVRVVQPRLVCRLEFDAVEESTRHKSGLTLRGARASRLLIDADAENAGTLDYVLGYLSGGG